MVTCDTKHDRGVPYCACGWVNWDHAQQLADLWHANPDLLAEARTRGDLDTLEQHVLGFDFAEENIV